LKVEVTIAGDRMTVDWTGSSPEVPGAINCPSAFVKSAVHLIVKCLSDTDIPNFEGFLRPLEIILPERSIVNPSPPAACAARAIVGWRAIDLLLGAFAQIVPDRVPAAGEGGVTFPAISGTHNGKRFVCSETLAGSWGAMCDRDGEFGIPNSGGNLTNQPIEMLEAQFPIEMRRYGMVENSGGPGKFRGAPAYIREYRMLGDDTVVVMRSDRRNYLPYGLDGGAPGTPSWNLVNPGPDQRVLPVMPMEAVRFARNDVFCHIGAGGGGHGDPLERDPALVTDDVREERITRGYAAAVYGVVFVADTLEVDGEATDAKRSALRAAPPTGRPAYLELFHAALDITSFELQGERYLKV
jgi:N-methylhydantoinase B